MIPQWFRREVPERGASIERATLIHPSFGITALWLRGIAQDWGAQAEVVRYLANLRRSQLSVLLAGRGYFQSPRGPVLLRPGDAVLADQRISAIEGYLGDPAEVIIVEWDDGSIVGPLRAGHPEVSRLPPGDVARLRAHMAELRATPPERWAMELLRQLGSLGLPIERGERLRGPTDPRDAPIIDAMGDALDSFAQHPTQTELAEVLGVTERQARRRFKQHCEDFAQPYDSYRDFLSDARLGWVTQLLSVPDLPLPRVAALAGFRSVIALYHALRLRGAGTPTAMARRLAERWR